MIKNVFFPELTLCEDTKAIKHSLKEIRNRTVGRRSFPLLKQIHMLGWRAWKLLFLDHIDLYFIIKFLFWYLFGWRQHLKNRMYEIFIYHSFIFETIKIFICIQFSLKNEVFRTIMFGGLDLRMHQTIHPLINTPGHLYIF